MKNSMNDRAPDGPVVPFVCNADRIVSDNEQKSGKIRVGWHRDIMGSIILSSLWMLEENGIDTTELLVAFENGDIPAIHAFFQKIRPTGADTGLHHNSDVSAEPETSD